MNTITEVNENEAQSSTGPSCGNPACGAPIIIIRGHRRRQYCDNTCKTAAGRWRAAEQERLEREEQARQRAESERKEILRTYGELQTETVELLRELKQWSWSRADAVGQAIRAERSLLLAQIEELHLQLSQNERREGSQ